MASIVRENAERDSRYAPYCLACPTWERMQTVEKFFWQCRHCGAQHDERTPAAPTIEGNPDNG